MVVFIMLIPFSVFLSQLKWWIMLMCAADLIFLAIYAYKTKALKRK